MTIGGRGIERYAALDPLRGVGPVGEVELFCIEIDVRPPEAAQPTRPQPAEDCERDSAGADVSLAFPDRC